MLSFYQFIVFFCNKFLMMYRFREFVFCTANILTTVMEYLWGLTRNVHWHDHFFFSGGRCHIPSYYIPSYYVMSLHSNWVQFHQVIKKPWKCFLFSWTRRRLRLNDERKTSSGLLRANRQTMFI